MSLTMRVCHVDLHVSVHVRLQLFNEWPNTHHSVIAWRNRVLFCFRKVYTIHVRFATYFFGLNRWLSGILIMKEAIQKNEQVLEELNKPRTTKHMIRNEQNSRCTSIELFIVRIVAFEFTCILGSKILSWSGQLCANKAIIQKKNDILVIPLWWAHIAVNV